MASKKCNAGGRPAAGYFILLVQNKVTKQKDALLRRPFGVPFRSSPSLAAAQLALCAQTVLADFSGSVAVLGGSERDKPTCEIDMFGFD